MSLRVVTIALTWIAFGVVMTLALLFVMAYRGFMMQQLMIDYGMVLVLITSLLMVTAVLLRYRAGLMMLSRGQLDEALRYCQPRSTVTLTVGRDEAAINRYVAAEAHRRRGAATAALALLDSEHTTPRSASLSRMLRIARAAAMIDSGRAEEGKALLDAVEPEIRRKEVRAALKDARGLLGEPPLGA
ncbi:MAG: hypothetical protein CMH57_15675 [Myxococcales bacterium]|nr:hypothetical protein [Myxococcales bacterium]